jgi:hypothetical protein
VWLSWTGTVQADAVTDWNDIAVQALALPPPPMTPPPRPGPVVFLDLAIVQAAVHDAVQAFEKRFEPYHVNISNASGSPIAAVATAARDVLIDILPSQTDSLNTQYKDYLASQGLLETDPGVAVGQQAADGILDLRDDDGRVPDPLPPPFTGGTAPGEWRPTPSLQPGPPPSNAPMAIPWLGGVPPFTLESGDQFHAKAQPRLTSKRYAKDYNEVKDMGARANSARTPEQDQLAYFYAGNNFILWNRILREVAAANTNTLGDNARLLALGTLAIADAFITCWADKIHYVFWRPITAIREGENDGNARTVGDPNWEPFLNTPNYPDYTSGANNAVGALTRTLELFFGTDQITFTAVSEHPLANPKTRTYERFSDLSWDTVDVRIYHGIHFRFADEAARKQGRRVAKWVFKHFLRPVNR